jgi:ribosomal protein S18 acetylase RimI-like enzyme
VRCFAWQDGQLIGAGRAITDGVSSSAVYDVVVDPDCQRQGVGTQLMRNLLSKLPIGQVMLISVPGREQFYESLGFRRLRTGFVLMSGFDAWEREGYFVDDRVPPA